MKQENHKKDGRIKTEQGIQREKKMSEMEERTRRRIENLEGNTEAERTGSKRQS